MLEHAEEGDGVVELPELQERGALGDFVLPGADAPPAAPSGLKPCTALGEARALQWGQLPLPCHLLSPAAGRKPRTSLLLLATGLKDLTREELDLQQQELKLKKGLGRVFAHSLNIGQNYKQSPRSSLSR